MTIGEFAAKYNLRLKTNKQDDTQVIQGQIGHIYEYSPEALGLMIFPPGEPRPRLYSAIKKKCLSVGMTLRQNGDAEGAFSVDPHDKQQAKTAIKVAAIRLNKRISEAHKGKLRAPESGGWQGSAADARAIRSHSFAAFPGR